MRHSVAVREIRFNKRRWVPRLDWVVAESGFENVGQFVETLNT